MIDRLHRIITGAGAEAGPEELADILWLARCIADASAPRSEASPESGREPQQPRPANELTPPGPTPTPPPPPRASSVPKTGDSLFTAKPPPAQPSGTLAPPRTPQPPRPRRGTPVRVTRAASLDNPLGVMRALRPLGRRRIEGNRTELDEERTAEAGVDHHTLLPVLRPAREPWLDLTLVVDAHRSMLLWHDLVAELRTLLTQTGLFRTLRVWFLGSSPSGRVTVSSTLGGPPRAPRELITGHRHSLILLVSDTVSEAWHRPELRAAVGQWSARGTVALLNVLPERLWERGGVRPYPCLIRATGLAAPNVSWNLTPPPGDPAVPRAVLPMIDASPAALSALAALVSGSGRPLRLPCLPLDGDWAPGASPTTLRADDASAALRALRWFEESASPGARELAGFLAAVPLTLPVMNLVRRAMLPGSDHGHLAEVALGGLLQPWEAYDRADPTYMEFRFLPGVRDALLGGQLRREIAAVRELVREEVSLYLGERRGAGDFPAIRQTGIGTHVIDADALPFARTTALDDHASAQPAYVVIAEVLREEIAAGTPPVGERLPTQFQLAQRFHVSRGTVQRALRELEEEGWVYSRQGSGTFVMPRLPQSPSAVVHADEQLPRSRTGGLNDAVNRAFEASEVTIDAVVGGMGPLLAALGPQVARVAEGVVRPASVRVRVLLMGMGGSRDLDALRRQFTDIMTRASIELSFEMRTSATRPPTELYLLNGRIALTSYVYFPGDDPDALLLQPEDRLEETRTWFDSWWELYGQER